VQIAPVAVRANVAAGTVYRYLPFQGRADFRTDRRSLGDELAAIRRAADAAPGRHRRWLPRSTTVAVHVLSQRKLRWGILAEPGRRRRVGLKARKPPRHRRRDRFPDRSRDPRGHLPAQDTALAASALLGALHESLVGPHGAGQSGTTRASCATRPDRDATGAARDRVMDARPAASWCRRCAGEDGLVGAVKFARCDALQVASDLSCRIAYSRRRFSKSSHGGFMTTTIRVCQMAGGIKDGKGAISTGAAR